MTRLGLPMGDVLAARVPCHTAAVMVVGHRSHLSPHCWFELLSPVAQFLVACPPHSFHSWVGQDAPWAIAGAVPPAALCALDSWVLGVTGKVGSDLVLDSGINKQSNDGRSCWDLLMPLHN